jgi:hypothetical protein
MMAASVVPRERVSAAKVRLFAPDGAFLMRATSEQVDKLLAAGLAEWRGRDLRMIGESWRRGLDGLRVTKSETPENARGVFSFATRTLPADGGLR